MGGDVIVDVGGVGSTEHCSLGTVGGYALHLACCSASYDLKDRRQILALSGKSLRAWVRSAAGMAVDPGLSEALAAQVRPFTGCRAFWTRNATASAFRPPDVIEGLQAV